MVRTHTSIDFRTRPFPSRLLLKQLNPMVRALVLLASSILFISPANASVDAPTGPSESLTGNYSIAYPWDAADPGCDWVELQESGNSGANWVWVHDTNYDGIVPFTDHSVGIYQYRAQAECEDYYGEYSWEEYSDSISVIVGGTPVLESLEDQLDYGYEVRYGDINNDSRNDLYIDRVSGGDPNSGVLYETILTQAADGTFSVLSTATTAQKTVAQSWPLAVIEVVLADFNADGYVDILLKELGTLLTGVDDQIVFSEGALYGNKAKKSRSIDPELLKFIGNLYGWILDKEYFDPYYTPGYFEEGYGYECHFVFDFDLWWNPALVQDLWWDIECSYDDYEYWVPGEYDSTFVDDRSVEAAAILEGIWNGSVLSGASAIQRLGQILEEILDVDIFGGLFGLGTSIYVDADGIHRSEGSLVPFLLAQLIKSSSTTTAGSVMITNPLPGSSINKKNYAGSNCTSDGRYDPTGQYRGGNKHRGVDLGSGTSTISVGTDVVAAGAGRAVPAYIPTSDAGRLVEVYHIAGFVSRYLHLSSTAYAVITRVTAGEVIGEVGRTGNVSSCAKTHLHFEIKGLGNIDPTPLFNWPLEQ